MKKILWITAILSIGLTSQLFAAKYSVSVFLDARVGGYIVGGGSAFETAAVEVVTAPDGSLQYTNTKSGGDAIGVEADKIDDSEIIFKASVDNVDAQVKFERQASDNAIIKFNSAYVQVNDIFGLLTIRFYDWDYAAGSSANEGNYILSDIGFQGFYSSIKPIDILSLGFGFGLSSSSIRGIRLDLQVGGPVPTGIYIGFVVNSSDNKGGVVKEGTIERLQVGVESKLYGDYIKLGIGVLPFGSVLKYYKTTVDTTTTAQSRIHTIAEKPTTDDISYAIDLSGKASFLDGLVGLSYGIQYVPDTLTKLMSAGRRGSSYFFTAPDADGNSVAPVANSEGVDTVYPSNHAYQALQGDGTDLLEMIAVKIGPSVTIGQFTFGLPIKYELLGTTYSGVKLRDKPLHRIEIDPQVTWKPAKGISVVAIMGIDLATKSSPIAAPTLGDYLIRAGGPGPSFGGNFGLEDVFGELRIGASFGVASEE